MRPVSGFERAWMQWLFVGVGLVLVLVAGAEAAAIWRLRAETNRLRAADLNGRIEREQLQASFAREQTARAALSLEVARLRGSSSGGPPTLTLTPAGKRGPTPPDPSVAQPAPNQSIQLRLVMPSGARPRGARYTALVRGWASGDAIWSRGGLSASTIDGREMVTTFMTGDVLAPGSYEIVLTTRSDNRDTDVATYEIAVGPAVNPPTRR